MFRMNQIGLISYVCTFYFDSAAFRCKLESIRLDIKKHLLNPLHVTTNHKTFLVAVVNILESFINLDNLDPHVVSFFFLDHVDFLDGFFDIEIA